MFGRGTSIRVGGNLIVGDKFSCNVNTLISCNHKITFGSECLLGWNVNIRDSDNHTVIVNDVPREKDFCPVSIGNHVWIASYADVLKGVSIPDNSIVAYRACVTKSFFNSTGVLLAGCPAKVIRENINWHV